jgi:LPXTG-motif cell wall-anchored protein
MNWTATGQATLEHDCVPTTPHPVVEADVTLCHATGSTTNPFVKITVSAAGAFNGHLGSSHQNGEDIIPPFEFNGHTYSQNWDAAGRATFNNNCVRPTGGQGGGEQPGGGGQVLGTSITITPVSGGFGASAELANTGESTMSGLFVALAILGLTGISAYTTRRRYDM